MASSKTNFILGLLLTASVVQLCNGEDPICTITARKCEFPFPHDGTDEKQCILLSEKDLGGMKVNDEDSYYCSQVDPRQKLPSWGQCNEACFINGDKNSEFLNVMRRIHSHYITAPNPAPILSTLSDPSRSRGIRTRAPILICWLQKCSCGVRFSLHLLRKTSTHFLIIPFLSSSVHI